MVTGAIHYYTFLADPESCPYVISFQIARSNHEYGNTKKKIDN